MEYYGAKGLAESFRTVRKNTLAVAGDIPEDKYGFRPAAGSRSVAEPLVDIATSNRLQHKFRGVNRRTSFAGIHFAAVVSEFEAEERRLRIPK
jgi:hypothetical protein